MKRFDIGICWLRNGEMETSVTGIKRLKYLFVTRDAFPPFRVDVVELFAKRFPRCGHDIHWVMQAAGPCDEAFQTQWEGGQVWVGANDLNQTLIGRLRNRIRALSNTMKIYGLLRRGHYDFAQVKDLFFAAIVVLIASRRLRTKFVYWLSFPYTEESFLLAADARGTRRLIYYGRGLVQAWLLYRIIFPRADHIFVQSVEMKRRFVIKGVPASKITAVPMGFNGELVQKVLEADGASVLQAPNNETWITYVGSLTRTRQPRFLLDAFSIVSDAVEEARLVLVGAGDMPGEKDELKELIREYGLEAKVRRVGFLPLADALALVKCSTICVSPLPPTPAFDVASPTKLVEYMAIGKPVVVTEHPEQTLLVNKSTCGHSVPYDEREFASAVIDLIRNPDKAVEMGKRGREYISAERDYSNIANIVESQYCRIAGLRVQ